jgi:hypothetical protein
MQVKQIFYIKANQHTHLPVMCLIRASITSVTLIPRDSPQYQVEPNQMLLYG